MRSRTVTRYYCDHCNKGLFHKKAMLRHEGSCIRNRERVCSLCEEFELEQVPTPELLKACEEGGLDALLDLCECSACRLSAIVQFQRSPAWTSMDCMEDWPFNYREDLAEMRRGNHETHPAVAESIARSLP